jgi:Tfp pilus assembly protein PilF
LLREQIELSPRMPQIYGIYGFFLMQRGRYAEAVAQYEKAVALGPYPLVVEQVEQAKRLRDLKR